MMTPRHTRKKENKESRKARKRESNSILSWFPGFFVGFFFFSLSGVALAEASKASLALDPKHVLFFESKIRPLLVEHCYSCHSVEKGKKKGGLHLDTRSALLAGGDSGPVIMAGKPDQSRLVKAIGYANPDLKMPPKGKLTEDQIASLETWVRMGAPDPRDGPSSKGTESVRVELGRKHWAFQPVSHPRSPAVKDTTWPKGDIDRFLLAKLEAGGLAPAADTDRYTWLRRVSLDLTGFAPTPGQIESFVQDKSPEAFDRVVDRLLASKGFGERWARHWLDLVGYADQVGTANDVPAVHAWRYRDYAIASFNADKPFDRFVREQLAGDLLPARSDAERRDQLIATGFLVLGNLNVVEADKLQLRWDVVDQQIEKVGKTFLGLTLQCARCHDHKFDPIPATDYYALAGIFGSTESTYFTRRGIWSAPVCLELPEPPPERSARATALKEHDDHAAKLRAERTEAIARREEIQRRLEALKVEKNAGERDTLEKEKTSVAARIRSLEQRQYHLDFIRPAASLAYGVREAVAADAHILIRGNPHAPGETVPRGYVQVASQGAVPPIPSGQSGRRQLADWLVAPTNPLTARVTVNRIWGKLFGQGLVRSVDYFGVRGDVLSHPELLDYLAGRFVESGWSQKKMIREMVLSRAFRIGNVGTPQALKTDPENRLLSRMHPRRLDAEVVRDAMLALSGDLLPGGGPALPLEIPENVGNLDPKDVNPVSFSLKKFRDVQQRQRTIYLPVVRSSAQRGPAEVLDVFDFPQPALFTGERPVTTVAPQALFLLNGPFVAAQANRLAEDLLKANGENAQHVQALYLRVVSRPASDAEIREALAFIASFGPSSARREAWARLCHALLMCNEFLFRL
jgi:mono/diheme cytochrome c family protein